MTVFDDRARFQRAAAERRSLLELGKIEVVEPPDTRDFTRRIQLEAAAAAAKRDADGNR